MNNVALGIDVGGSGIKGAAVDLTSGALVTTRHKVLTPPGGTPEDIAREISVMATAIRRELAEATPEATPERLSLPAELPIGVALPGVIKNGVMLTAANLDEAWISRDARALCAEAAGTACSVVNDADAAGLAEARFGAAKNLPGTTMVLTFGTGIGSALVHDGVLVPNFELGHLHFDGHSDIEQYAAPRVIKRDGVSLTEWAERAAAYLRHLEVLFHPDRFVIGGGISRDAASYLPFTGVSTPVLPAHLHNNAGIVGAAWLAHSDAQGYTAPR